MYGREYQATSDELSFRPAVYAVIINQDKVLLSKQYGKYGLPGGGVEVDETLEEALYREVKEETGLQVEIERILDCKNRFFRAPSGAHWNVVSVFYRCRHAGGELSTDYLDEDEVGNVEKAVWVGLADIDTLEYLTFAVDQPQLIKQAINN